MIIRSYRELQRIETIEDRFEYLSLKGAVGQATFGFERYLNQAFYTSKEWRRIRRDVIARDNGCDLGVPDYEIHDRIVIHHINPISEQDLHDRSPNLFDMNNLITTSHQTHNAIHYGDRSLLRQPMVERRRGDTQLW